jgi:hypothetical protein
MSNGEKNPELWKLFETERNTTELSHHELQVLKSGLGSQRLDERAIASSTLLSNAAPPSLKNLAIQTLAGVCQTLLDSGEPFHAGFLRRLLPVPESDLIAADAFKSFIYQAAKHPTYQYRANAVLLLFQLAKVGDQDSLQLLQSALNDSDETVRNNARICLNKLTNC